jgi:hypothetical protein
MTEDLAVVEQLREYRAGQPQMVDPDRRIDQDHLDFGRRRGIFLRSGSLPPRRASRPRRLTLDQCLEGLADKSRFLMYPGVELSLF